MADAFPISGSIDPKAFPFLLMDLHRHGATGSLKVDGPSYQKALYFRGGRILFGSSNDPRDQLGSILIESGKITPEQLEDVNAKVGPGNPLAKALSDSGCVNQRELGEAARAKVERILSDVIAYDSGSFEFEDGVLPKGAVDLKLSTERVVMAAVRRVSDRNFVLRHLESLEVLLRPTPAMAAVLPELQSEAGGLPEQLDGRRTLKEVAALTPLDEFEAAKVACALLFLGLAERSTAAAASEMDLGQTARLAFDESPSLPTVIMQASPVAAPDEAPTEVHEEPLAAPEPAFFLPQPSHSAPLGFDSAAAGASHPPAISEPEPLSPEIDLSAPPPVPEVPAPRPSASSPPFIPPRARGHEPEPIRVPEVPVPAAATSRPSKEDLAALDALLNSRTLEGPMTPLEKPAASQGRWEPKFGQPPPARRGARRSGPSPILLGAAAVAVLGGAGGAWLYFNKDSKKSPGSVTSAATTLPRLAGSPAATPLPAASPGAASPTMIPPTATTLGARPSATTLAATPPATPSSGGTGVLADARTLLREGKLSEAAHGFAAHIKKASTGSFSIQILVACSDETVQKAVDNVAAPELYIVPVNYKGRDCYRLCWGIYESQARADSAVGSVPEYFRKGGAAPRVVPTSGLLP